MNHEPGEGAAPKRELCAVAKLGRKCSDDICRGSQITLCGFDQDDWDDEIGHACDLPLDPEHGDEFPCYGCETLWEWDATENEWEGIGEAIEEVGGE